MACFSTHARAGALLGTGVGVIALVCLPDVRLFQAFVLFMLCFIGALAPDLDSDTSVPFHATFALIATVTAGAAGWYAWQRSPSDYQSVVVYILASYFFVWGILGALCKRLTTHRGMAHSIPVAVLFGLLISLGARQIHVSESSVMLYGLSGTLGYLLHLTLDEVWAAVNFHGHLFVPNKALGSALKFLGDSHLMNMLVYALVLAAILPQQDALRSLFDQMRNFRV